MPSFEFKGRQYRESPADPAVVSTLSADVEVDLPEAYLSILQLSNGGGGPLGVEPGWFQLWPAEEVVPSNRDYQISEYLPGLFGFGSNGGGELLAFDTRREKPWSVVMVPFIPMDEGDVVEIAKDFKEFLKATGCNMPTD